MIRIETHPADNPLFGQSKWWGEPDMPEELDYPEVMVTDEGGETYPDPLTFVCQIRCEDLAALDPDALLPHTGMLYFFAALDYFLGDIGTPAYPGLGEWQTKYFRVLYAPSFTLTRSSQQTALLPHCLPKPSPFPNVGKQATVSASWALPIWRKSAPICPACFLCCKWMKTTAGSSAFTTAVCSTS